ncbi:glycosyltransferase [Lactiplantibacillus plantarum]|uniref:glycosyltransferase n=1 Tax=Lactiplantibacillus plantarum TaxID=1590 RepID=UPI000E59D36A|nr:glycosyltransferase [Lactiplantibacillus plantarum]RHX73030.1 glycosyltransferase [Lactiplantibacillus plantarum]
MRISVVIATYNGEKYIQDQLQSIINQTRRPDEIIISDDGSVDKTTEIIHEIQSNTQGIEIKQLLNKGVHGFVGNFTFGLRVSSGDIVFLSDQDDIWKKDKIEQYLNSFQNNPSVAVVHGEIDIVELGGGLITKGSQHYSQGIKMITFSNFLKKPNYPGMSLAFRKSVLDKYLLIMDEFGDIINTHDWLLAAIGESMGGLYSINYSYADRRYTGENVALNIRSNAISKIERLNSIEVIIKQLDLLKMFVDNNLLTFSESQINQLTNLKVAMKKRSKFLKKKNFMNLLKLLKDWKLMPSKKTIFGDLLSK